MKRYEVTLSLIVGYYPDTNEGAGEPKLRYDRFTVNANSEEEAITKAKVMDTSKLSVYESYADEIEDQSLLGSWGLLAVTIQSNDLIGASRPTTQEDNHAEILDRIDLYAKPETLNNGLLSDMKEGKAKHIAHLIKYNNGSFSLFTNSMRINITNSTDVLIG